MEKENKQNNEKEKKMNIKNGKLFTSLEVKTKLLANEMKSETTTSFLLCIYFLSCYKNRNEM